MVDRDSIDAGSMSIHYFLLPFIFIWSVSDNNYFSIAQSCNKNDSIFSWSPSNTIHRSVIFVESVKAGED